MRNGIEIWLDNDKANIIGKSLIQNSRGMLKIENRFLNAVDILGIFKPQDLDDLKKRQKGWWQCNKGFWHAKNEECTGHLKKELDPRGWYKN